MRSAAEATTSTQVATAASAPAPAPPARVGWLLAGLPPMLRKHWPAFLLVAVGLTLRALSLVAYHPAILYTDTLKYLYGAWQGADPLGYAVILKAILAVGDLGTVAFVQHLAGVGVAVAIYVLVLRAGGADRPLTRWLAVLAMAPILLDAYEIQIEQTIMPDVWFAVFAIAGLAILVWRPVPSATMAAVAGLLLGASALIRQVGLAFFVPAVIFLHVACIRRAASAPELAEAGEPDGTAAARQRSSEAWQRALRRSVLFAAAFAAPVIGYSMISAAGGGPVGLSAAGGIAGRVAASVDCATIRLPPPVQAMCPTPRQQAYGPDWLEHDHHSPFKSAPVPPGWTRAEMIGDFDSAVEQQQPLRVISAILGDSVRIFAFTKNAVPGATPISRWRFQTRFPTYRPEITLGPQNKIIMGVQTTATAPFRFRELSPAYGGAAQVNRPIAGLLRAYQLRGGFTPGPLLAAFALAGLAGTVLALRRRRPADPTSHEESADPASDDSGGPASDDDSADPADRGDSADSAGATGPAAPGASRIADPAATSLLFFIAAVFVLQVSDIFEFSWRYQLPALFLLPPAGALGLLALLGLRQPSPRVSAPTPAT
jgi:hypothetical protein